MRTIKLQQQLLLSKEYQNAARLKVFITLLFIASDEGRIVTTLSTLANRTSLTIKQIRSALTALCKAGKIDKFSTHLNTTIIICNYDSYTI